MKSVQVPAGESSIDFRFDPTLLRAATAAAYLAWTLAAAVWLLLATGLLWFPPQS
jgi:hypothetical protein